MKLKYFFALSLIVNLIFTIQWVRIGSWKADDPGSSGMREKVETASALSQETPDGDNVEVEVRPSEQVFSWETLESEDYLTYMENLRRIGCPEETIADIIKSDVVKMFEQRRDEMLAGLPELEYWKGLDYLNGYISQIDLKAFRLLEEEKHSVLKTLLGKNYGSSTVPHTQLLEEVIRKKTLGFLPEGKSRAVYEIYDQIQSEMVEVSNENRDDPTIRAGLLSDLLAKRDQQVAALLTPEEKFEADLRMHGSAHALRHTTDAMNATEEEFREIFALQQKINKDHQVEYYSGDTESRDRFHAARQQMMEELKNLLGEDRYRDYTLALDPNFKRFHKIAESSGLERVATVEAYDIQMAAQDAVRQLQSQPGISPESMKEAANQIYAETTAALQDKLGSRGWEQFKNSSFGSDLERLRELNSIQPVEGH